MTRTMHIRHPRHPARYLAEAIHIVAWLYIFASPLFHMSYRESIHWDRYAAGCLMPAMLCALFYANYLWLVPRCYCQGRRGRFVLMNALLIALLLGAHSLAFGLLLPQPPPRRHAGPPHWWFPLNGALMAAFTAGVALALRLSREWAASEAARREAELGRTAAELENLRGQISPHFLLNTLNNIYALTAFDAAKAQHAIEELSRMLRYLLYENRGETVSLEREMSFIGSYVELMRLRLPARVEVTADLRPPAPGAVSHVAPLIFIPLVENAFKHGVHPTRPSFIHISLSSDAEAVRFVCRNSNHPAPPRAGAAGGVGLELVRRRLALAYPGRHEWHHGPDPTGQTYVCTLTIRP